MSAERRLIYVGTTLFYFLSFNLSGQYPSVPGNIKQETEVIMQRAQKASDEAWEKALPIINKEALEGKPYIPWASRPTDLPQAKIPAFPGAEGGGMYSFGGRGGKVITITSLEDSGPGTLREACEQGGARIVVFNVSGIIRIKTPIIIRAPYITIAGQTAPGDGVLVAGESVWVNTHDVVIRHMRFRRGETNVGRRDDALGGNPVGNILIDHVSASWGLDENISFYRHMYDPGNGKRVKLGTVNLTIQNSISSEALDTYNHSFGSTLGGENASFMRNIWANNTGRNPSIGWNGVFNFVNNVLFNWWHRTVDGGDYTALYNIINNYYKPGPVTPENKPVGHRILKPETGRSELGRLVFGRAYVDGNIVEGNEKVSADNWDGGVQVEDLPNTGKYRDLIRVDEPFPMPFLTILPAEEAYEYVLENAGATFPKRDAVDERIINQVRTGEIHYPDSMEVQTGSEYIRRRLPADSYKMGIIIDPLQVGGYPEYKGTPYRDSDGDGMPDAWEIKYKKLGLDPNNPGDANVDCNGDGYTNIETYINGMDPEKTVDWTNPENNYDTLKENGGVGYN
ncbi:MAG: polysaccharide lyase [Bacteroidales bacterium]|nr:polysaccharide lyase [Bacteroidales bacterium]